MGRQVSSWSPSRLGLIGLNLCLYSLFAYWLAKNIDPVVFVDQFTRVPIWAIAGSTAIYLGTLAMYGVRMALLLTRDFALSFKIVNLGYALNTVVPLRMGEALKIVLASRLFGIPKTMLLAASVMEKLFDLMKLLLLTGLVTTFSGAWPTLMGTGLPMAIFIVLTVSLIVLIRVFIVRIVRWLPKRNRFRQIAIELHKHVGGYRLGWIALATAGIWVLNVCLIDFTFNTFLPGVSVSFADAAILYFMLALAVAVPSAPAGIGLFEAVIVTFLSRNSGVGYEAALAAATVLHAVISLPQLLLCVPLLWSSRHLQGKEPAHPQMVADQAVTLNPERDSVI